MKGEEEFVPSPIPSNSATDPQGPMKKKLYISGTPNWIQQWNYSSIKFSRNKVIPLMSWQNCIKFDNMFFF